MISLLSGISSTLLFGTITMLFLAITLIIFIIFHQRKVIRYQLTMQEMEAEQQEILLRASLKMQEEERQRIAADLHDDAGPMLATARLYLTENMVNLDKPSQLQSISTARHIIDDAIQLIRNISHSLMPPILKDFGLEDAVIDFFQKLNGAGSFSAKCHFYNYQTRFIAEKELIVFRVIQELVNNILKHSQSSFVKLTEHDNNENITIKIEHDGKGLTQEDYIKKSKSSVGLGLKNIQSRLKVIHGDIFFETNSSLTSYTVVIDIPKEFHEK